jgi:uncharacterized membrane protein
VIPSRRFWPWWRWVMTGLSALALALSCYLAWHFLRGGAVIGCGPGASGCNDVLNSRWSAIGGVLPVSGLAAGAWLAMLLNSLFLGPGTAPPVRRLAWRVMLVLTGAAAGSAVWFTFVQVRFIGAFCPYCMAAHTIGVVLAALVIWQAPRQFEVEVSTNSPRRVIGPLSVIGVALTGAALAGVLAVCQIALSTKSVSPGGKSQDDLRALDPHAVPLVGSADAPYVVVLLFDYKCPHCQQLHFMLQEAIRHYDGKLAFALCPAPLNTNCNPYIPQNVEEFADSCELAKVALAVWVAKRDAFPIFDRWMFTLDSGDRWHPRGLDAARAKAIELVGQSKFDAARTDPWIDRYLQTTVRIYGNAGGGAVPKLVFGSRWVTPGPNDAGELELILRDRLAVPEP